MLKMLREFATNKVMIAKQKINSTMKPINEVIEEIHETFYTEVDKLLVEAKISNSLDTGKQYLLNKCERLKALGFTNTKEVKEAKLELERLEVLKQENEAKKTLIDAINYFSFKYPNYKFITEESVKKICEKYNLVYGEIDRYIGTVPDKNLKHIEDFKVHLEDECYFEEAFLNTRIAGIRTSIGNKYKSFNELKRNNEDTLNDYYAIRFENKTIRYIDKKCPLEIVAPLVDFNMEGIEVKEHKISKVEIPDPIVLKPVIFNNQKYYLIVTAWGIEAGDSLVVNENHN